MRSAQQIQVPEQVLAVPNNAHNSFKTLIDEKMKKLFIILIVVLITGVFNACTSDEISPTDPGPGTGPGGTEQRP
jgi:hypothetical protein